MLENGNLLDYVKTGLELIWAGLKFAASWTWQQLTEGWKAVCKKSYDLVVGWASKADEVILAACQAVNCPKEYLPPKTKDLIEKILRESQRFLSEQLNSLKEFFSDLGRTAYHCAENVIS